MNALELTAAEVNEWTPAVQAIGKLADAHFKLFNEMERSNKRAYRRRALRALGTLQRAAEYVRTQDLRGACSTCR
jgi:hypothetical protein